MNAREEIGCEGQRHVCQCGLVHYVGKSPAEEELERLLTEELRKYTYTVTHDLKEPLRTILVQTQKIMRSSPDQLPADATERLTKVITAVSRMQILLDRLRDYANVNLDVQLGPVDCNAAVGTALTSLETAIEETQAEVIVGDLPTVTGTREHLELLFQNLISNSLKFRSPDRTPRIEVGAQRQADGWLFWVKDNGEGIEPKFWERIFEIGARLNHRTSGWGYGLAICEKVVKRRDGRIWVASEPGLGSTFYFTLSHQSPLGE